MSSWFLGTIIQNSASSWLAQALMLFVLNACGGADSGDFHDGTEGGVGSGGTTRSDGSAQQSGSGGAPAGRDGGGTSNQMDASAAIPPLSAADEACRLGSDAVSCLDCCDAHHPNGYLPQEDAARKCVCTSPGPCATQCVDSYCVSQPQTRVDCYTCVFSTLVVGGTCFDATISACGTDQECLGYVVCRANCVR